jgi:hypothetical protein
LFGLGRLNLLRHKNVFHFIPRTSFTKTSRDISTNEEIIGGNHGFLAGQTRTMFIRLPIDLLPIFVSATNQKRHR